MDSSLADWLALREAADWASRSERLTTLIAGAVAAATPVRILDLATGTGSNLRYLAEKLPPLQYWTVVDRDPALLAQLTERTRLWASSRGYELSVRPSGFVIRGEQLDCRVETQQRDLYALDDSGLFADRHLVTASALLDLVSETWLRSLAAHCGNAGAAALFTLTYDGRSPCVPADREDDLVRELFNRHQRTDKGLGGLAAGPDATEAAVRAFRDAGFRVEREQSDWVIEPGEAALQRELIGGWKQAATEIAPEIATHIANWELRRLQHVSEGESLLIVGHEDIAAVPIE